MKYFYFRFVIIFVIFFLNIYYAFAQSCTYPCILSNVLTNPNFSNTLDCNSSLNNGFFTDFNVDCLPDFASSGNYIINNNAHNVNPSSWINIYDHTGDVNGKFLIVDGYNNSFATPKKIIWKQNVNVVNNKSYNFKFWYTLLQVSDFTSQIEIRINNYSEVFTFDNVVEWKSKCVNWMSNTTGLVEITILQHAYNTISNGDDMGFDDFSFGEVNSDFSANFNNPNLYINNVVTNYNLGQHLITNGITGDFTFHWTPSLGLSNPNIQNPTLDVSKIVYCNQSYELLISSPFCAKTINLNVTPTPLPNLSLQVFTFNKFDNCEDKIVSFNNLLEAGQYYWDFGDNTQTLLTSDMTVNHVYSLPGYYEVTLFKYNDYCARKYKQIIQILPSTDSYNQNCCISQVNNYNYVDLDITNNTTWNNLNYRIKGTIYIKSGGVLQIDNSSIIEFGPQGRIIVEGGGTLSLNNCKLTSLLNLNCNNSSYSPTSYNTMMWNGIEVWGNPAVSSTSSEQGKVIVLNSTIENAHIGIKCGKSRLTNEGNVFKFNDFDKTKSGGIVDVQYSTFNRNALSILILDNPFKKQVKINNNTFKCKNSIGAIDNILDSYYFNANQNIGYINMAHNPFYIGSPLFISSYQEKVSLIGIYALNSELIEIKSNIFTNLYLGILCSDNRLLVSNNDFLNIYYSGIEDYASQANPIKYKIIRENSISSKGHGIYSNASMYLRAENNIINGAHSYGISLINSSGFSITDNTFTNNYIGIYSFSTKKPIGTIGYKNNGNLFTNCVTGISLDGNNEIRIKCNTHTNTNQIINLNYTEVWKINGTLIDQGVSNSINSIIPQLKRPAGNIFYETTPLSNHIESNTTYFNYFHHIDNFTKPQAKTNTSKVFFLNNQIAYSAKSSVCSPNVEISENNPAPVKEEIKFLKRRLDTINVELINFKNQVDNYGDTASLINWLSNIYDTNGLMQFTTNSHHFSDRLINLLINRIDIISPNNVDLLNILSPILPINKKNFAYLRSIIVNKYNQLTLDEVLKLQFDFSNNQNIETLNSDILNVKYLRDLYLNEIIRFYLDSDDLDSVINILDYEFKINGSREYLSTIVSLYIQKNNDEAAEQYLNLFNNNIIEESLLFEYYSILIKKLKNNQSAYDLDSSELYVIRNIAENCFDYKVVSYAKNLLYFSKGEISEICNTIFSKTMNLYGNKPNDSTFFDHKIQCILYPNPTESKISIKFNRIFSGKLKIYNTLGQFVEECSIDKLDLFYFNIESYPKGIYLIKLYDNNSKNIISDKIIKI